MSHTTTSPPAAKTTRRSTREDWLREPENPEPAHPTDTRYPVAPAKVQAALALMQKVAPALAAAQRVAPTVHKTARARRVACQFAPIIQKANMGLSAANAKSRARPMSSAIPRERRRASHAAQAGHKRAATRSSTRSGDSGEPSSPSDPDEDSPAERRVCAALGCNQLVHSAKATYCNTRRCRRARDRDRQRKRRADLDRDWVAVLEREQLEAARICGYIGEDAYKPADHALSFLWKFGFSPGLDPGEYEAILWRVCRCNGHHINNGEGGCSRCGKSRTRLHHGGVAS